MNYQVQVSGKFTKPIDITGLESMLESLFKNLTGENVTIFNNSSPAPKKNWKNPSPIGAQLNPLRK